MCLGFSRALARLCTGWCWLTREQSNDRKQLHLYFLYLYLYLYLILRALTCLCTGWLTRKPSNDRTQRTPQKAASAFRCDPKEGISLKTSHECFCQRSMSQLQATLSWIQREVLNQENLWMAQREKLFFVNFKRFRFFMRIEPAAVLLEGVQSFFRKSIINSSCWLPRSKDNWRNPVSQFKSLEKISRLSQK